jgi:hypothetical protein
MSQYAVGVIADKLLKNIPNIGAFAAVAVAEDIHEGLVEADVIEATA